MNRITFGVAASAALLCLFTATPVLAQHDHHAATAAPAASVPLTEGTVKKIDKARKQLTLAHGPLENLGMGAMTMSFAVKDPNLMAGLKVGDKVRFFADYVGNEITITRIEAAK